MNTWLITPSLDSDISQVGKVINFWIKKCFHDDCRELIALMNLYYYICTMYLVGGTVCQLHVINCCRQYSLLVSVYNVHNYMWAERQKTVCNDFVKHLQYQLYLRSKLTFCCKLLLKISVIELKTLSEILSTIWFHWYVLIHVFLCFRNETFIIFREKRQREWDWLGTTWPPHKVQYMLH